MPRVPPPELSHPWVPVPAADPDPADSSSTSSGEWYENVQGAEPPGDPSPHPGEDPALAGQEWGGVGGGCAGLLCPRRIHPPLPARFLLTGSPSQAGRPHPAPRGDTRRTPTPPRAATTMTSRALPTEGAPPPRTRGHGGGGLAQPRTRHPAPAVSSGLLWPSPPCRGTGTGPGVTWGTLGAGELCQAACSH